MDRNPESPWNPRMPAEITSTEFEKLVLAWLRKCTAGDGLPVETTHLGIVEGAGGAYSIDVYVRLTLLGGAHVDVLVECKHKGRPVEREAVMVLEAKLRDVGAHKGMLFSTSGFQKGALQYATARGIATVTVIEGKWLYETKGATLCPVEPPPWVHFDDFAGQSLTAKGESVSCHTIELDRVVALRDWLSEKTPAAKRG
jgi:restriction system protein